MATTTHQPRNKDESPLREPDHPRENKDTNPANEPMDKAKEMGSQVMDKAREIGGQVTDKAREAMSSMGEMATSFGKKADDFAATAGTGVQGLGDKLEQQGPHEGMLGQASHAVADGLRTGGRYIEEARLSGMAGDMAGMIRRNPLPAVLVGVCFGFLLGRAMRA